MPKITLLLCCLFATACSLPKNPDFLDLFSTNPSNTIQLNSVSGDAAYPAQYFLTRNDLETNIESSDFAYNKTLPPNRDYSALITLGMVSEAIAPPKPKKYEPSIVKIQRDKVNKEKLKQAKARGKRLAKINELEVKAAKEKAEQAAAARTAFLANMSHEIRTPINGIFGVLQVLRGTTLNEEQQHYIETLDSCSKNLLLLIDDVLDLSRIESGKLVLDIEPFETFGWITDIQNLAEPFFENKKTIFITKVSNNLPAYLEGDVARLLQIIVNLLSNAAKCTHDGEVELAIGGQLITENKFNLQITIKDTGIGIENDKLKFIFETFNQIDSDRTIKNGVGLGLAICKRLTDIMDGSLQVASELGKGSCFTFSSILSVPKKSFSLEGTEGKFKINRELSILLVDDDSINRFAARTLLEQAGQKIVEAENGKIAIEKIKSQFFDVILMDIHMPVMDGVSATRAIREGSTKAKQVPIIGLTASVMKDEKDRYLRAGMNAGVAKPIVIKKLMETIQKSL